jgi:hypothetical protein
MNQKKVTGYFQIDKEEFGIAIVEKSFWDKHHMLSDSGLGVLEEKIPEGFYELSDSFFEYDGDMNEARAKLKEIGLEEKELFEL